MPIGVITNCLSLVTGGLIGLLLRSRMSERLKTSLPLIFGIISMAMGIIGIFKVHHLPSVALSLLTGTLLGELFRLEDRLYAWAERLIHRIYRYRAHRINIGVLMGVAVLFCASGTGIFGAMESRLLGDHTLLFTKSLLDFFTSMIFAMVLGSVVCWIAIPQFVILGTIFLLSGLIAPYTSAEMLQDFSACGGMIMLATGIRIAEIKKISIVNMLPSLLAVMPISFLFNAIF
ncbi:DUF554 domain-containing protein [Marasmitruncus massiliensis]|uniref:DUF554 domain-containing protein n=1 Tax=Marasmitruncus massiliensis TaxID=1944642 RepID=UPI000C7E4860|nr:DUF554 domain-containing protein [Marasmitruncus massiliensis]